MVGDEIKIHKDPIFLTDAAQCISESATSAAANVSDVRLTGQNLGNLISSKCHSLNLDMKKCQGMDGAANMSSEVKGAAAVVRQEAPIALYFHCMMP